MSDDDKREKRKKIEEKRGHREGGSSDDIGLISDDSQSVKRSKTNPHLTPSPVMFEPSSPVGTAVSEAHQSTFNSSNRSRAAEIYILSKSVKAERNVADCQVNEEQKIGKDRSPPQLLPLLSSLIDTTPETAQQTSSFHPEVADEVLRDIPG